MFLRGQVQGGVWLLSSRLCDTLMAMDVMLCTASIFNLCAISVDRWVGTLGAPLPTPPPRPPLHSEASPRPWPSRFVAVTVPLRYNSQGQRQLLLIAATWLLSAAVAAPVLCGLNDVPGRDPTVCRLEDRDYVVYSSVCSFFLPCPLMLLLYWATFRGLRRWEAARHAKLHSRAPRRPSGPGPPVSDPAQGPFFPDRPPPSPSLLPSPGGSGGREPDLSRSPCSPEPPLPEAVLPPPPPAPPCSRRRGAKITGRERKAMRVLPVVVGGFLPRAKS